MGDGERGPEMLAEALVALASLAGNTVVAAATTDVWEAARHRFARLLGRGDPKQEQLAQRRLDDTHNELAAASGAELEQARTALAATWAMRLTDLLEEDPGLEAELRSLVEEIGSTLAGPGPSAADHSVVAGGNVNITGSGSAVVAGVIHGGVSTTGNPSRPGPQGAQVDPD